MTRSQFCVQRDPFDRAVFGSDRGIEFSKGTSLIVNFASGFGSGFLRGPVFVFEDLTVQE